MKKIMMMVLMAMMVIWVPLAQADVAVNIFGINGNQDPFVGWDGADSTPVSGSRMNVEWNSDPTQILLKGSYGTRIEEVILTTIDANGHQIKSKIDPYNFDLGLYNFEMPQVNQDTGSWVVTTIEMKTNEGLFAHVVAEGENVQGWETISSQAVNKANLDFGQMSDGKVWTQVVTGFGSQGEFNTPYWADGSLVATYKDVKNLSITTSAIWNKGGDRIGLEGEAPLKVFTSQTSYKFTDWFNDVENTNTQTTLRNFQKWALNYQANLAALQEGGNANEVFAPLGIYLEQ